jgi:hypothetical protein
VRHSTSRYIIRRLSRHGQTLIGTSPPLFSRHLLRFQRYTLLFHPVELMEASNKTTVLKLMRVSRLWRGLMEEFLYSALYVEEEWRVEMFIDTIKENPKLAEQLRTLVIMPRSSQGREGTLFGAARHASINLCHGVVAIVMDPYVFQVPFLSSNRFGSSRVCCCSQRSVYGRKISPPL